MQGAASNEVPPADLAAALAVRRDLDWVRLVYRAEVGSTNDVAAALASSGASHGTTVLAGRQTAGRGRRGRTWHSPPGAGLYLSTVLRGPQSPLLTLLAGVAAAEAVRAGVGLAADLKWPNDVGPGGARWGPSVAATQGGRHPDRATPGRGGGGRRCWGSASTCDGAATLPSWRSRPWRSRRRRAGRSIADRCWPGSSRASDAGGKWRRPAGRPGCSIAGANCRRARRAPACRGTDTGPAATAGTAGIADDGALLVDCGGRTERIVGGEVRWG